MRQIQFTLPVLEEQLHLTLICVKPPDMFIDTSGLQPCLWRQKKVFKSTSDVFLALTEWFYVTKPNQNINTALSPRAIQN